MGSAESRILRLEISLVRPDGPPCSQLVCAFQAKVGTYKNEVPKGWRWTQAGSEITP